MTNCKLNKFIFSIIILLSLQVEGQDAETIENAEKFYRSGVFYYSNNSFNNAINAFNNCNKLVPNAITCYYLGLCYKNKRNWSAAMNAMNNALAFEINPLRQKFKSDANRIRQACIDRLNGTTTYISGDALTRLPAVPAKNDNPFPSIRRNLPQHQFKIITDRIIFPGMGVRNNNQTIGDFCCTGETATILREGNVPIGYIYFYSSERATDVAAAKFTVSVSAVPSINNPNTDRIQDEITFDAASELYQNATKSRIVGGLKFKVTILSVRTTGRSFFTEGLRIQVDITAVQ